MYKKQVTKYEHAFNRVIFEHFNMFDALLALKLMTPLSSLYKNTVTICADAGFTPNIAIQTDDPFYVRKYIEMGLGISFVPTKSWKGPFPDNVVLKKLENVQRNTCAFLPKRKYIKPVVKVFLQVLNEEAVNVLCD